RADAAEDPRAGGARGQAAHGAGAAPRGAAHAQADRADQGPVRPHAARHAPQPHRVSDRGGRGRAARWRKPGDGVGVSALTVDVAADGVRVPVSLARVAALARAGLRAERVRAAELSITFVGRARIAALNWLHLR